MLFCCPDDLGTADFITEEEKKLSGTTVIILIAFVFYLAMMIVIGAVYMKKTSSSEDYFLGGRGLDVYKRQQEYLHGRPLIIRRKSR